MDALIKEIRAVIAKHGAEVSVLKRWASPYDGVYKARLEIRTRD